MQLLGWLRGPGRPSEQPHRGAEHLKAGSLTSVHCVFAEPRKGGERRGPTSC